MLAADEILAGKIQVFGDYAMQFGEETDWNRDPKTGVRARMKYSLSLDLSSWQEVGSIKHLWEPNRHLHLVTLAQAFKVTDDIEYLQEIRRQLDSWIDQCPFMVGPNWASGLEASIRLINWSVVWQLVSKNASEQTIAVFDQEFRIRLGQSIHDHLEFVQRHYSRYSSANNHLIGEAAGVFIATCTWPCWDRCESLRKQAWAILNNEIFLQTHPDGVNKEQAIAYQQFVLDFFLLCGLCAETVNVQVADEYWDQIRKMIVFLASVTDVSGNVPMFGDSDDGFVVKLSREPSFSPYLSLMATGAAIFNNNWLLQKAGPVDDKTRFLLEEMQPPTASGKQLNRRAVSSGDLSFPIGGYYILGVDIDLPTEVRMIVDCGPLGYRSIAAHGHADALAVVLSCSGREFLVDPGTFLYQGEKIWRDYFRGTSAHNTVVVDGSDQSVSGGPFMWTKHANAKCLKYKTKLEEDHFVGKHDGYLRLNDPVLHTREITRISRNFTITDRIDCRGQHTVTQYWHFSDKCDVVADGRRIIASNSGTEISMSIMSEQTEVHRIRGSEAPIGGWISDAYDSKRPTTTIACVTRIDGNTALQVEINCTRV